MSASELYALPMQLDRNDVLVLKSLRHGAADAIEFPDAAATVVSLIDRGLVRPDTVVPTLTDEGAKLAAMLEREWPN